MPQLGVQIIGSNLGLRATLDESVVAANAWADAMTASGARAGEGIAAAMGTADEAQVGLRDSYVKSVDAAGIWSSETLAAAVRSARGLELTGVAALQAEVAYGKLGMAVSRYSAGTVGEAQAVARYTATVQGLYDKQILAANAAASAQERAMLKFEGAARGVGRTLATYVTLPLAAAGYEAIKLGIDFQASMTRIYTYAGASMAEVQQQQADILNHANQLPQGPIQASESLFHLESIGLRGASAFNTLKAAALAAGAGEADLTDATTALGGAMVANIKGAENARIAMAGLVTTAGEGNMTMQQLVDALGTGLLVKASNVGISLREVGSALAVLVDRGIPARRAATYLGTTFALMVAPSREATNALADMGVNAEQMRVALKEPGGLLNVLEMLKAGMDRVGHQRGIADLMSAFGRSRQSTGIQTLVESMDSNVSSYTLKLAAYDRGVQHAQERMVAYQQTAQYKLHTALSEIEADFIRIGMQIAPDVAAGIHHIADFVTTLTSAFEGLPKPIREGLGAIALMLALGGPVLLGFAYLSKVLRGTQLLLRGLGPASVEGAAGVESSMFGIKMSTEAATTAAYALRAALLGALAAAVLVYGEEKLIHGFDSAQSLENNAAANAPHYGLKEVMNVAAELAAMRAKGPLDKGAMTSLYARLGGQDAASEQLVAEAFQYLKGGASRQKVIQEEAAAHRKPGQHPTAHHLHPPGRVMPFTTEQQIQLALLQNPNDAKAMEAQIRYDNQQLQHLKMLRQEGKINNLQYLTEVQSIYSDRNSWMSKLNSLDHKNTTKAAQAWHPPLLMQIALSAAEAAVAARMAAKGIPFSASMLKRAQQSDPKVRKAEEEEVAWIMRKIHSGTLTAKAEIAAYNELTKLNKALAEATSGTSAMLGPYKIHGLAWYTRGIADPRVRKQVEARISEGQAFSGHVPVGTHATYITIHHAHIHGGHDPKKVVDQLERYGRQGSPTRRGISAGHRVGT